MCFQCTILVCEMYDLAQFSLLNREMLNLWCLFKPLQRSYQKWTSIIHLEIWSLSYDQKNGRESN